jgi:hypothetical protein
MPSPIPGMLAQYKWKWRYDFQLAFGKRLTRLSVDPARVFYGAACVRWAVVNKALSRARAARRNAGKCRDFPQEFTGLRPAGENPNGDAAI